MSIQNYQQLQYDSLQNAALIGNRLPECYSGSLDISAQELNLLETCAYICAFNAHAGWVMFSDHIEINNCNPEQGYIIEGEWSNGEQSLVVKLLQDNRYRVTRFTSEKNKASNTIYTEQTIYLRPELQDQTDANACRYHCWWQQAQDGEQKGRWLPLAQQFIGFTKADDIVQSSRGDE